jgi:hypothetical protein
MNTTLQILLCLLGASSVVHADEHVSAMQIGSAEYARGSLPRGAEWVGLFCDSQGCILRPVVVAIEDAVAYDVLDEAQPVERLLVDGEPAAIFADAGLQPGAVDTTYMAAWPGAAGPDKAQGRWTIRSTPRPVVLSWMPAEDGQTFHHVISDGRRTQALFSLAAEGHYGGDTSLPEILWAGDLDRDGRIDLLLSLPDDNCGYDQRLYLSSRARAGELLRLSAQHAGMLPACGC